MAAAARASALMMSRPVTFVTGNAKKLEEVRAILGNSIPFRSLKLDCKLHSIYSLSLSLSNSLFIYFLISQCQNCKASLKISPKRRLAWLPLRSALSVSYIICICVCMCVYISIIECVGYIECKGKWASAGGRHLPLFQCSKGTTWYVIFSPFSFCWVPFLFICAIPTCTDWQNCVYSAWLLIYLVVWNYCRAIHVSSVFLSTSVLRWSSVSHQFFRALGYAICVCWIWL